MLCILSVYSPFSDNIPSPFLSVMDIIFVDLKFNGSDYGILNWDSATRVPPNAEPSLPDVSLASTSLITPCSWPTLSTLSSDHLPILIRLQMKTTTTTCGSKRHSGLKLLCKLCRTSPPPAMGARFTVFWAFGPAGWLALLLTKAGDVETNPGPTTLNKKVWICDICHKQIHVRKQISIRCNRIEHWVHLICAGIRQAQYTDTWTCHLHR